MFLLGFEQGSGSIAVRGGPSFPRPTSGPSTLTRPPLANFDRRFYPRQTAKNLRPSREEELHCRREPDSPIRSARLFKYRLNAIDHRDDDDESDYCNQTPHCLRLLRLLLQLDRKKQELLSVSVKGAIWKNPREGVFGRGGGIRTRDPLRPRQVRYQAALRPDRHSYCTTLYFFVLLAFAGSSRRYAAAAR